MNGLRDGLQRCDETFLGPARMHIGIVVLFACIGRLIGSGSAVYRGPECLCLHTPYADALSQPPSLHEEVTNNYALYKRTSHIGKQERLDETKIVQAGCG